MLINRNQNQNCRKKKSQTEHRAHRFVTVNIAGKTMKRQKIQRVDVNRKLKRSNAVDNIAMCKSQTGWKLQL
jgi:hypothetical protein